jgi:hypothetical protein
MNVTSHARRFAVLVSGLSVLLIGAAGQERQDPEPWRWFVSLGKARERVLGLLDLPELVGEGCGPADPKRANLYDTPSAAKPPVAEIEFFVASREPDGHACSYAALGVRRAGRTSTERLPYDESGYEYPAAIVYERAGRWFRIALMRGSAWVHREGPLGFHQYPESLKDDHLTYVKKGWDGRLWRTPGDSTSTPVPPAWKPYLDDNATIEVLGVRRTGQDVWIRIRLVTDDCEGTIDGVPPVEGWIPAYRPSGETSIWFWSRGC